MIKKIVASPRRYKFRNEYHSNVSGTYDVNLMMARTERFPAQRLDLSLFAKDLLDDSWALGVTNIEMIHSPEHSQRIASADLSFPILVNGTYEVFNGKHRIVRALSEGQDSILAVVVPDDVIESCKLSSVANEPAFLERVQILESDLGPQREETIERFAGCLVSDDIVPGVKNFLAAQLFSVRAKIDAANLDDAIVVSGDKIVRGAEIYMKAALLRRRTVIIREIVHGSV